MKSVAIPRKLAPLVRAFSEDEAVAKILIIEAAKAIAQGEKKGMLDYGDKNLSTEELEGVVALIKGLQPKDTIEAIYSAQIVASHLMGLRLLRHDFASDQVLGLKLLRFSNEAMIQLQKKKSGGSCQNITINHNYNGQAPVFTQSNILPEK